MSTIESTHVGASPESCGRRYKEAMSQIGASRTRMRCHRRQKRRKFQDGASVSTLCDVQETSRKIKPTKNPRLLHLGGQC